MRRATVAALALAVILAAGCGGEPRLDGSSQPAFDQSVQQVRKSLPEARQEEFGEAMVKIALKSGAISTAGVDEGRLRREVDGLTGRQVIARAKDIDLNPLEGGALEAAERAVEKAARDD